MASNTLIETEALRRSPAAHLAETMAAATVTGERAVALREVAFTTQLGLRVAPGTAGHQAVADAAGVALPTAVGEVTGNAEGTAVLWLGPDEFLLIAPEDATLAARLTEALADAPGQVVDLSANRSMLELVGPSAPLVLRKSCPADLHPREFGVHHAIATTVANIPVLLWRAGEQSWRILPRASFTEHTVHWLVDAMIEFRSAEVA